MCETRDVDKSECKRRCRRRIEEAAAEFERELATGATVSAADWSSRYPDLEPELSVMIRAQLSRPTAETPHGPESSAALLETVQGQAPTLADPALNSAAVIPESAFAETMPSISAVADSHLVETLAQAASGQPAGSGHAYDVTVPSEQRPPSAGRPRCASAGANEFAISATTSQSPCSARAAWASSTRPARSA